MTSETPEPGEQPRTTRQRPSIAERAARREYTETHGRDRYDSLLRQLRGGRELSLEEGGRVRLQWHPVAGKIMLAVALAAAVYLVATAVAGFLREGRVDTWAGPTATVQSGQRLDSCADVPRRNDPVFPTWVRFDGGIFIQADAELPVGETNIGTYYHDSGYTNGNLRLYTVSLGGLGEPGTRILIRTGDAPAAELYRLVEGCS
jgi:hypothetical protein